MLFSETLSRLIDGHSLARDEMRAVMEQAMTGQLTPAQIGALLVALRIKGETPAEITAGAEVMRSLATRVEVPTDGLVDTCGTGGDAAGTFNISTASALVAAACGVRVAKHGNRSVSSKSGSADVLEAFGVRLDLTPEQVATCIEEVGVGFLFAPAHHGAMKHAIGPRRELGIRTVFNLLGPLTNPAGAPNQVLGVFADRWVQPMAEALHALGSRHVLVVHAEVGLDEVSIDGRTRVAELRDGRIREYTVDPDEFSLRQAPLDALRVNSIAESVDCIRAAFSGEKGPVSDVIALNAGAAVYVSGQVTTWADGVALAMTALERGGAMQTLERLVELSQRLATAGQREPGDGSGMQPSGGQVSRRSHHNEGGA